jgi:hypothetical protein
VIVVGDEAGERGDELANAFRCADTLRIPFSEVRIDQFEDPYQVTRVLKALLDAPRVSGTRQAGLVERVMNTPLLTV